MEHQLWLTIVAVLRSLDNPRVRPQPYFSDQRIVEVYYWAVLHDRPTCWACQKANWPLEQRRRPLPSAPTMSRRLRSPSVRALLDALEQRVVAPSEPGGLYWMLDGKPLPIGGCSKDRQAGFGRGDLCHAPRYGARWHAGNGDQAHPAAGRGAGHLSVQGKFQHGRPLATVARRQGAG